MKRARTSRKRYESFLQAYRDRRTDDLSAGADGKDKPQPAARAERRRYLANYVSWLRPHVKAIVLLLLLAALGAGLDMLPPLFLRYVVDHVLLVRDVPDARRLSLLHLVGTLFLAVIITGRLVEAGRSYRQRQVNARTMLSLRRSLYERLLYLPLQKLSELKIGGIISRLSGDVDTTSGLLQLAVISPSLSALRLVIAVTILFFLNWRLAVTALAVIPGAILISFTVSRRVRPIYRAIREDKADVEGRVGETFGGIRVVRAFRREVREEHDYAVGHHSALRKELFAHRRELLLWGSWGALIALVDLVIVWYGGYLNIRGIASIGDIMAFQWYTFVLLNPIAHSLRRSMMSFRICWASSRACAETPAPPAGNVCIPRSSNRSGTAASAAAVRSSRLARTPTERARWRRESRTRNCSRARASCERTVPLGRPSAVATSRALLPSR